MKDLQSPLTFRWVMENTYPPKVKQCWNCGKDLFIQKSVNEPFICVHCGKEN